MRLQTRGILLDDVAIQIDGLLSSSFLDEGARARQLISGGPNQTLGTSLRRFPRRHGRAFLELLGGLVCGGLIPDRLGGRATLGARSGRGLERRLDDRLIVLRTSVPGRRPHFGKQLDLPLIGVDLLPDLLPAPLTLLRGHDSGRTSLRIQSM